MLKLRLNIERCKGCGFCIFSCPKEAIKSSEQLNKEGYNFVEVDNEKCIKCGICYSVCPDNVFELY